MVTVVSNYCQLSQTQLSQTFAEKFTVTEELLQSLKKTALSGDEEREGANKRGNSSRLTQSFHFFMFEPIFSPVNALNQPI